MFGFMKQAQYLHRIHFHTQLITVRAAQAGEKTLCESTCYLMIYHSDISLWSTGPSKPWSWISFPAVRL